jgi:hypothetical protein
MENEKVDDYVVFGIVGRIRVTSLDFLVYFIRKELHGDVNFVTKRKKGNFLKIVDADADSIPPARADGNGT